MKQPGSAYSAGADAAFPVRWLFALLTAAALVQIYAGLELLALRWDSGPFLVTVLSKGAFYSYEPARLTTQAILELPTLIAIQLGVTGLDALSAIWSLTLQLTPLALTSICYLILPARHKIFFVFPVVHYFAGASSVATAGLIEGPTATAYFWVVFYLVLFSPERWTAQIALAALAAGTLGLHEVMAILAPFLVYAAWWRSRQASRPMPRLFFLSLAVLFLLTTAWQIGNVIYPKIVRNRDGFVVDLLRLKWLYTRWAGINTPAALGLLAAIAIPGIWRFPRYAAWIIAAFAIATVAFTAAYLPVEKLGFSMVQFYARNHPAMVSIPLSAMVLAALHWPDHASRLLSLKPFHSLAIVALVAAGGLVTQYATARDWASYVTAFRETLAERSGFIAWEDLMRQLPAERVQLFERMNFDWTNPDLSLLFSPDGRVRSLLMNPKTATWQPWDPTILARWPRGDFYDRSGFQFGDYGVSPPQQND